MSTTKSSTTEPALEIDLRDPWLAGLLAWLVPGAGHLYQRRTGKGLLFMICILSTYFFGLALGDELFPGRTVADELLVPSVIYAPAVTRLLGDVDVRAVAHITGGGIVGNLPRVLPAGVYARLDA